MTPPLGPATVRALQATVGAPNVIVDPDRLLAYESDGLTAYRVPPRAVVLPASTPEVSKVVELLHQEGIAVIPRGAGTGLSGGALPTEDGVVVGTARMNTILEIDPDDRLATVQPGVINARLTQATEPYGLYYAPDPSSQSTCTLGGNVAENSGGPHCLKYGVTSRYVTGLTVVLEGGRVVRFGGAGRSVAPTLDLVGLFVGSEGCFGIVTEIEVRLLPIAAGVRIIGSGLMPAAVEIIDKATIEAVEASVFAAGYPKGVGAALVIEFDGTEAGLDDDADRAERCCMEAGAREVRRATSEEERLGLWKGRKKAFGAMGRIAPDLLVQDATVPRTKLPEVLARITEIGAAYGLNIANVFHAGDGNLHPNILFDRNDPEELARVERASHEIMKLCVDAGGTITGEHGVGVDKREYMDLVHNEVELDMLRRVRRVFDERSLFNPGKVVPDPDPEPVAQPAMSGAGQESP